MRGNEKPQTLLISTIKYNVSGNYNFEQVLGWFVCTMYWTVFGSQNKTKVVWKTSSYILFYRTDQGEASKNNSKLGPWPNLIGPPTHPLKLGPYKRL